MPAPISRGGKKTKVSHLPGKQRPVGCDLDHPTDFSSPFDFQGGNVFAALIQDQSEEEEEQEKHPPKPAKPEKNRINKVKRWPCRAVPPT